MSISESSFLIDCFLRMNYLVYYILYWCCFFQTKNFSVKSHFFQPKRNEVIEVMIQLIFYIKWGFHFQIKTCSRHIFIEILIMFQDLFEKLFSRANYMII